MSLPFADANGLKDDLFRKESAYPIDKGRTIKLFSEPTILGRKITFLL